MQDSAELQEEEDEETVVNIDEEKSLLVVRAAQGNADALVAPDHLSASVSIGQFEIVDLLSGSKSAHHRHLARSFENEASDTGA